MTQTPFFLSAVVWGRSYVHRFINYSLPTYLSPNNAPALVGKRTCEFLIASTEADFRFMEQAAAFRALRELMPVRIIPIDFDSLNIPPILKMSLGHRLICKYVSTQNGCCMFLGADYLLADGSIRYLHERFMTGSKKAFVMPGFRVIEDNLVDFLSPHISPGQTAISIAPRELASIILNHMHPEMASYIVDRENFSPTPNYLMWHMKKEKCLIVRALHQHPLLVDLTGAQHFASLAENTIDGDFLGQFIDDWGLIEVVQDSDQVCVASLTPGTERLVDYPPNRADPDVVKHWCYSSVMTPLHRFLVSMPVVIHAGDIPDDHRDVTRESRLFIDRALDLRKHLIVKGQDISDLYTIPEICSAIWCIGKSMALKLFSRVRTAIYWLPSATRSFIQYGRSVRKLEDQNRQLSEENQRLKDLVASRPGDKQ